ncbi:DNA repair protein rad10 [Nitzschia inconspicua]|uniref:DNA repair protein rad10 n=1 Tax=Nitzschia inconspicua TaxID=303405 RepID=A0A9K3LU59_9STRA|nr:DNA repair protein rad10 [Nitzschia inconspicua]
MAPGPAYNPYASKKRPLPDAPGEGGMSAGATISTSSSLLPSNFQIQPATFSQAFGDDSVIENPNFGTGAVTSATNTNNTDSAPNNDPRQFHAHLQPHVLAVSPRQKGNGLLQYIKNVPIQYSTMVPDYIMSTTSCALFLSLKYHQLYPQYVHRRLSELGKDFRLRVLLVLVDVEDCANALLFLNKLGVTHRLTVILSWSEAEAARYLETYKAFDGKDASSIQKRESTNVTDQVADFITACKPFNKTDAGTVWQQFGTLAGVAQASPDELALCPGLGTVKVHRLHAALHKPFSKRAMKERKRKQQLLEETKQRLEDQKLAQQESAAVELQENEDQEEEEFDG